MSDQRIRVVLRLAAVFNVMGGIAFAFPGVLSPWVDLGDPPLLYRAIVALFVWLFAGTYWWAAGLTRVDRTVVGLGAIGKSGAFFVSFACYALGTAPGLLVAMFAGDLALAGMFAAWLWQDPAAV